MPNKATSKSSSSKRGFAAMPKEKTKEIAKKGEEHSHGGGRPSGSGNNE